MLTNDIGVMVAFDRRREQLAAAERERLVARYSNRLPLARRMARPLGRALFGLGAWLLRYGKDERVVTAVYRPNAGSPKLN